MIAANVRDFKGICTIAREAFFFRKSLFLTLTSSSSKVFNSIALKISAKQINLIAKKIMSSMGKIMNINTNFRILLDASHNVFLKKALKRKQN